MNYVYLESTFILHVGLLMCNDVVRNSLSAIHSCTTCQNTQIVNGT
jgi:hypothetical protein